MLLPKTESRNYADWYIVFRWWAATALCSVLESSLGIIFVCVPALAPLFTTWVGESSNARYHETPNGPEEASDQPPTFGKLGFRQKRKPNDESILYETEITKKGANNERNTVVENYEMDNNMERFTGDSGSERRILSEEERPREVDSRDKDKRRSIRVES